jgi:hypothetical protein
METKEEREYRMIIKSYYDSLNGKVSDDDFNRLYSDYISNQKQEKRIKVIDVLLNHLDDGK